MIVRENSPILKINEKLLRSFCTSIKSTKIQIQETKIWDEFAVLHPLSIKKGKVARPKTERKKIKV